MLCEIIAVKPGLTPSFAQKYTITLKCEDGTILKDEIPLTKKNRYRAFRLLDLLEIFGTRIHDSMMKCKGKKVKITIDNGIINYGL